MRNLLLQLLPALCCVAASISVSVQATTPSNLMNISAISIKVGAGVRPPFLISNTKGMGPELLAAINLIQDKFYFELVPTSINRRVQSVKDGWVDIVMWDNIHWGWQGMAMDVTYPLLNAKDIFITHTANSKEQQFFAELKGKRVCGVNGYHYKFLNFSTNISTMKLDFEMTFVRTEVESIKMALHQRCDISVVSTSALSWYMTQHNLDPATLLLSDSYDTRYTRHFLVPVYAPISAAELNQIMKKAHSLKLLEPIYKRYGQSFPQFNGAD